MMLKTRVLHIITRLDRGGSTENTLLTVSGLARAGYEVTLLSGPSADPMQRLLDKAQSSGVRVIFSENLLREISPWRDVKAFLSIYRQVKRGNYRLVHTHSSKAGIIGRWAAYLAGVSHLIHTPHGHIFYGYYDLLTTRFFILLERITAKICKKIIALTPAEVEDHLALNIGTREKYTVIPSGVELADFEKIDDAEHKIKAEFNIPRDSPLVGSVGRLEQVKGYEYFVKAMPLILKQSPNTYFLLAGDGSLRTALQQQCRNLGISHRLIFTGWREDIPRIISAMDIFIISSLNEGMGRVLVEAMALKKPIVATCVGGVPTLIKDGQNGRLIPAKDPLALANTVVELLKDKTAAKKLGLNSHIGIDQYSAQSMIRKTIRLYEEILGGSL